MWNLALPPVWFLARGRPPMPQAKREAKGRVFSRFYFPACGGPKWAGRKNAAEAACTGARPGTATLEMRKALIPESLLRIPELPGYSCSVGERGAGCQWKRVTRARL